MRAVGAAIDGFSGLFVEVQSNAWNGGIHVAFHARACGGGAGIQSTKAAVKSRTLLPFLLPAAGQLAGAARARFS